MIRTYNELISIIIPTYNPPLEKYKRCLKSVFDQLYDNIEVIIVDDGSNQKVRNFLSTVNDKRARIYHQDNLGVSVARNRGIEKSHGKYTLFVDADDYLDKDWLVKSTKYLAKNYDIVFGRVIECDDSTLKSMLEQHYDYAEKVYDKCSMIEVQKMLLSNSSIIPRLPLFSSLHFGPCGKLYKTEIIKNIQFPVGIALGEDQVFNNTVIKKCNKVVVTNYKAYYYIENNQSSGHVIRKDAVDIMMKAMKLVYNQLISQDEINDFYYLVIFNTSIMLPLEYKKNIIYDFGIISSLYKNNCFPLKEALRNIQIASLPNKKMKLRAFMYKYHLVYLNYLRHRIFM